MSIGEISAAKKWCDEARKILGKTPLSGERSDMGKRSDKVFKEIADLRKLLNEGRVADTENKLAKKLTEYEKRYIAIAKRAKKAYEEDDKEGVRIESEQLSLLKKELAVHLAKPEDQGKLQQKANAKRLDVQRKVSELLKDVHEQWFAELQKCQRLLDELSEISPSEHGKLDPRMERHSEKMAKLEPSKETYTEAVTELETLNEDITEKITAGKKAIKSVVGELKKAGKLVDSCDDVCTLDQKQKLYDRLVEAQEMAQPGGDYIVALHKTETLIKDTESTNRNQTELQEAYGRIREETKIPLGELEVITSRQEYQVHYEKFVSAQHESTLKNYAGAIGWLRTMQPALDNAIVAEQKKADDWVSYRNEIVPKITTKLANLVEAEKNREPKPWTTKYKAELIAEVEDICWKGDKLATFDFCKTALQTIWDEKLGAAQTTDEWTDKDTPVGTIAEEIREIQIAKGEAEELANAFRDEARSTELLIDQLQEKIRVSDPENIEAVAGLRMQLALVLGNLEKGNQLVPLENMRVAVKEGRVSLAKMNKDLNRLLSGSVEGTRELQDLVAVEAIRNEHEKLQKAWELAHNTADTKLTTLAQHGGTEYLTLLGTFEQAEKDAAVANKLFLDYRAQFPDVAKIEKKKKAHEEGLAKYNTATTAIGTTFTGRIETAISSAATKLNLAKQEFATAKLALKDAKPRTGLLGKGNKLADQFITQLLADSEGALAYEESTNATAVSAAAKMLQKIAVELRKVAADFTNDENVTGSFRNVEKRLKDLLAYIKNPVLKAMTPEVQAELRKRWDAVKLEIVGKSADEAIDIMLKCREKEVTPAINNATELQAIREKTPALVTEIENKVGQLITKINQRVTKKLPTAPPDLGTVSSEYKGCVNVINTEKKAGVAQAAYDRLVEIRDKKLDVKEKDLVAFGATANAAIEKAAQDAIDRIAKADELTKKVASFKKNDLVTIKSFVETNKGDAKAIKVIENLIKAAEESIKMDELISAEDQLGQLEQMKADTLNSGRGKSTKKLQPLGEQFAKKVTTIEEDIVRLKQAMRDAFADDPAATDEELNKALAAVPDKLSARGIVGGAFLKFLSQLDNPEETLSNRRAARESIMQLVRDYKRIVMKDPVLAAIRNNAFGVAIGSGPLYGQLRVIEDNVVVTT